eukprot:SAG11_NODE_30023_length_305_cov_0.485437_1_plen_62_part_01
MAACALGCAALCCEPNAKRLASCGALGSLAALLEHGTPRAKDEASRALCKLALPLCCLCCLL